MTPKSITREHVLEVLRELDRGGVPKKRQPTKFKLVHDGRSYPPKYVLARAAMLATGSELDPEQHSGGDESNQFLQGLGFEIQRIGTSEPVAQRAKSKPPRRSRSEAEPESEATSETPQSTRRHFKIGRLTVVGKWVGNLDNATRVLDELIAQFAGEYSFDYLCMPGAFLTFDWTGQPAESPVNIDAKRRQTLIDAVSGNELHSLLTKPRLEGLAKMTGMLTLGIDTYCRDGSKDPHAEFVLALNLTDGARHWTGKSYPTAYQERCLLRTDDLESHFLKHGSDRVMLLGCHDLNMFSARGRATAGGWRQSLLQEFERKAKRFAPNVVLQHPHTADTPNVWRMGWNGVHQALPTVKHWVGTGTYYNLWGEQRGELKATLEGTAGPDVLEIIIDASDLSGGFYTLD